MQHDAPVNRRMEMSVAAKRGATKRKPTKRAPTKRAPSVRERILAAAFAVLEEEGIRSLSQVQVARRAGVRQSHLTYYFPRRHDLVEAVSARFVEGLSAGIEELADGAHDLDAEELCALLAAVIVEESHMRIFTAVLVEADSDEALRTMLATQTRRLEAAIAAALPGADAAVRASALLSGLWGLGLYATLFGVEAAAALGRASLVPLARGAPQAPKARKRGRST